MKTVGNLTKNSRMGSIWIKKGDSFMKSKKINGIRPALFCNKYKTVTQTQ